MPRKAAVKRRSVAPDPIHGSPLVQKFINCLMSDGEKAVSEGIFYGALEKIRGRSEEDPVRIFKKAVENAKPLMEVKTRRVGGANYQVPVEVGYARQRGEKGMIERLAGELLDAYNGRGAAIKKKEDTHRMAEANRAFAHYRW